MSTQISLSADEIMERLGRLCRLGTSIRWRPASPADHHEGTTFPTGSSVWYLTMSGVIVHVHPLDMSGATPQEAVFRTWNKIVGLSDPLVRYFCKPDEAFPGNGLQVWVRWNSEKDDWEDVVLLRSNSLSSLASEIRPYAKHKLIEASFMQSKSCLDQGGL